MKIPRWMWWIPFLLVELFYIVAAFTDLPRTLGATFYLIVFTSQLLVIACLMCLLTYYFFGLHKKEVEGT